MRKKLASWKNESFNMVGKLVLANASLESILSHVMSYIKVPDKITHVMDKTIRYFIWGSTKREMKNAPC